MLSSFRRTALLGGAAIIALPSLPGTPTPDPEPAPPAPALEAGRIAPIAIDSDGRPFATPQSYWDSVAAEMAAERAAGLVGLASTVTHTAVQSGSWSSPATWGLAAGADVPGIGTAVDAVPRVPPGIRVTPNIPRGTARIVLRDLQVDEGARLIAPSNIAPSIVVSTLNCEGDLILGTASAPAEIEIRIRPMEDPGTSSRVGVVTHMHSVVRVHGKPRTPSVWPQDMLAGDTVIRADAIPADWAVGDELLIPARTYAGGTATPPAGYAFVPYWNDDSGPDTGGASAERPTPAAGLHWLSHDERRTIAAIDREAGTVTLDAALTYDHRTLTRTNKYTGYVSTLRARVEMLSKSVVIRAHDPINGMKNARGEVIRGHVMHMHSDDVDKRYYAHIDLGRTRTDATMTTANSDMLWTVVTDANGKRVQGTEHVNDPDNVRGRYADHIHRTGPYMARRAVILYGASWYNTVGAPINPGWMVSHHSSRVHIEHCVGHGALGAVMVSERGDEIGQWVGNLACYSPGDGHDASWGKRIERVQNHNGSQGVGYELQSRAVLMRDNEATSCKYAYFYMQQNQDDWLRNIEARDHRVWDPVCAGGRGSGGQDTAPLDDNLYGVEQGQILEWHDMAAVNCYDGFATGHRQGTARNDTLWMRANNFRVFHYQDFGFRAINYTGFYSFANACFVGRPSKAVGGIYRGSQTYFLVNVGVYMENIRYAVWDADFNYGGQDIDIDWQNNAEAYAHGDTGKISLKFPVEQHAHHGVHTPAPQFVSSDGASNTYLMRPPTPMRRADFPVPYPAKGTGIIADGVPWPAMGDPDMPAGMENVPRPWIVMDPGSTYTLPFGGNGGEKTTFRYWGKIADGVGIRRWPDWQTKQASKVESFYNKPNVWDAPAGYGRGNRDNGNFNVGSSGEKLVERNGCFQDENGVWKSRHWHADLDRLTDQPIQWHVDMTLTGPIGGSTGYTTEFLLRNRSRQADGAFGPRPAPDLSVPLESVLPHHVPVVPELAPLRGDWSLLGEAGAVVTQGLLAGRWTLLYFGYTNCPAVCPAELSKMVDLRAALPSANLQMVYVSIDPARDTPAVMAAHVAQFDAAMRGLTGSQAQVDAVRGLYGIKAISAAANAGEYAMSHTTSTFLVGPDGRCRRVFGADLAQSIRQAAITAEIAAG